MLRKLCSLGDRRVATEWQHMDCLFMTAICGAFNSPHIWPCSSFTKEFYKMKSRHVLRWTFLINKSNLWLNVDIVRRITSKTEFWTLNSMHNSGPLSTARMLLYLVDKRTGRVRIPPPALKNKLLLKYHSRAHYPLRETPPVAVASFEI